MSVSGACRLAAAALATLALPVGCGGEGGELAAPEPPAECVREWNGEQASTLFGRHVYGEHGARQGQAARLEPGAGGGAVRGEDACAVVFAVPSYDDEYGDVGLVRTRFGWAPIKELDRDRKRLAGLQAEAARAPNVTVFPDGTISPR